MGPKHVSVRSVAAIERVIASAAVEHIAAVAALKVVVAGAALEVVGLIGPVQPGLARHGRLKLPGQLRELGQAPDGAVGERDGIDLTRCQELRSFRPQQSEHEARAQIQAGLRVHPVVHIGQCDLLWPQRWHHHQLTVLDRPVRGCVLIHVSILPVADGYFWMSISPGHDLFVLLRRLRLRHLSRPFVAGSQNGPRCPPV